MAKCSVSAHWLSALGNKGAVKGAGNDLRNLHNVCRNSPRRRRQPPRGGSEVSAIPVNVHTKCYGTAAEFTAKAVTLTASHFLPRTMVSNRAF
ncbi:uncharacterized [Tachysurus ichikawai]